MSLVGWWKLDGDFDDYSVYGNHGTTVGSFADGKIGQCVNFASTTGSVIGNVDTLGLPTMTQNLTISFWVYPDSFPVSPSRHGIMQTAYGAEFAINITSIGSVQYYSGTSGGRITPFQVVTATSMLEVGKWQHVTVVRDITNKTIEFFKNGVSFVSHTWASPYYPAAQAVGYPLVLGWSYVGALVGKLNDVRIYDHAMSLREVKELAKTKMLHYKFNDFQEPTINEFDESVMVNSTYDGPGDIQIGELDAFGGTDNVVRRITGKVRFGNSVGVDVGTLYQGSTYTFSVYLRKVLGEIEPSGTFEFDICDLVDEVNFAGSLVDNLTYDWRRFAVTAYHDTNIAHHFTDIGEYLGTGVWEWCCAQIENKDHATPFVNIHNSRDGVIGDCSDYGRHAYSIIDNSYSYKIDHVDQYGTWLKIFNHESLINTNLFASAAEASYNDPNNPESNKFSILSQIPSFVRKDGKYKFKLSYPDVDVTNIWYQTNDPNIDGVYAVSGYEAISIDSTVQSWYGLARSSVPTTTYMDGCDGVSWWWSVGQITAYGGSSGGNPGPGVAVNKTELYICVENTSAFNAFPQWVSDGKTGGGCYRFDGIHRIVTNRIFMDTNIQSWTAAAWVKLDVNNTTQRLVDFNLGNNIIRGGTTKALLYINDGVNDAYTYSTGAMPVGEWFHLAFVLNTDTIRCQIYLNGSLHGSSANYAGTETPAGFVNSTIFGDWVQGQLDDIRIYATDLSSEDILELYQTKQSLDDVGNLYMNELVENTYWDEGIDNTNLLYNGDASVGDNSNFSPLTYYSPEKCFTYTSASSQWISNYYIPVIGNGVDTFDQYMLSGFFKQPTGTMSKFYYMIVCYDKDKNFIDHTRVAFYPNTQTVTTQTINNGDEYVYVDDLTNWYDDGLDGYVHQKTFACWPIGVAEYPPFTYSRHVNLVRFVDKTLNRLRLNTVWSGGTVPIGSPVTNSYSGSIYSYIAASNALMTPDWVYYSGSTYASAHIVGMRAGTSYVRVGCLINREAGTETSYMKDMKLYNITNPGQHTDFPFNQNVFLDTGEVGTNEISEVGIMDSLFGYWPLNGTAEDFSSNKYDGVIYGPTVSYGLGGASCYSFNGTSDYMVINDVIDLSSQVFTMSVWFNKKGAGGAFECVLHKSADNTIGNSDFWLGVNSTDNITATIGAGTGVGFAAGTTTTLAILDTWYHVCATWDGGVVRVYINGIEEITYSLNTIMNVSAVTRIGSSDTGSTYQFNGLVQDVRLYNKCLTLEQVNTVYKLLSPHTTSKMQLNDTTLGLCGEVKEIY
jgi:hypothetical protein